MEDKNRHHWGTFIKMSVQFLTLNHNKVCRSLSIAAVNRVKRKLFLGCLRGEIGRKVGRINLQSVSVCQREARVRQWSSSSTEVWCDYTVSKISITFNYLAAPTKMVEQRAQSVTNSPQAAISIPLSGWLHSVRLQLNVTSLQPSGRGCVMHFCCLSVTELKSHGVSSHGAAVHTEHRCWSWQETQMWECLWSMLI